MNTLRLTDAHIAALLEMHDLGTLRGWQPITRPGINPTFVVNNDLILRVNVREPESYTFQKEAALYRRLCAETDMPVPRVVALDVSRAIVPYDILVLERLHGVNTLDVWHQFDATTQRQISYDLGQALATLHCVRYTGYGGFNPALNDLGRACDWHVYLFDKTAEALVELWRCSGLPAALLNGAEEYILGSFIPATPPPVLVHGDFGLHNTLVELREDGWHVSGIVDFEWALAADAEYEFATGLLVEPDEVNPLAAPFLEGYRTRRPLAEGWEQRSAVYRLIYHLTLCAMVCRFYKASPAMLRYHRGMIVDILKAG